MSINKLEDRELDAKMAELMGWHWDDDWGCLIPPEQKAKPSEMWTDWKPDAEGLFREPVKGAMVSGISYNGDSSKIILPEYSRDIIAAWQVHQFACKWVFSKRKYYLQCLQDVVSQRMMPLNYRDLQSRISWPDVLVFLKPEDFCRAACMAVKAE